ncbi:hypothetical protein A3A55_03505 [Candidatus Roizmanbacteria bacterium RIFCSPLOWO2_01_FULL_40_14]|nr:MAG: hypothetical protein A3A55_03505 [Candidatus Roizmanbacteria bacterium RIFCSPLOWO2_01_FULL_40_14]
MKFLADENLPQVVINHIASKGYQIVDLKKTSNQGKTDSEICKIAKQNQKIIITYDKDFLRAAEFEKEVSVIILSFPKIKPQTILPWIDGLFTQLEKRQIVEPYILILYPDRIEIFRSNV